MPRAALLSGLLFWLVGPWIAPAVAKVPTASLSEDSWDEDSLDEPATPTDDTAATMAGLLSEASRALELNELEKASRLFEQARELDADSAMPWLGLSEAQRRRGNHLEALTSARRAQSLAPDQPETVRQVARLQIRVGAPAEALESLAALRALRPDDVESYVLAALVLRDVQRVEEAADLLRSALDRGLASASIFHQLALLELALGNAASAQSVARRGLEQHPENASIQLALGLALAADPETRASAVELLEAAIEKDVPEAGKAHLELGTLLLELAENGCDSKGIEHLRAARQLLPDSAEAHFRLGNGLRACGDLEGAKAALAEFQRLNRQSEARDHGKRSTGASLNQAQELAAQGRLGSALELLQELIEASPEDDRVWTLKAKVLYSMDQRPRALEAARRARELMPGRVENHYLEGLFLSQMGELNEARARLEAAVAIDAENGDAQALLAAVLAELGELEAAAGAFERALALKPTDPSLRLAYGRLLAAMGREEESRRQMEVYRALGGR